MPVEIARTISNLDESLPRARDLIKEGDDHIRLIKASLKNTFPGIDVPVTLTSTYLNTLNNTLDFSNGGFNVKTGLYVNASKTVDMGGNRIQNLGDPITDKDAMTYGFAKTNVWPIGSIYMSVDSRNPSLIFGYGTWNKFAQGRVIIGAGSTIDGNGDATVVTAGEIGGSVNGILSERHLAKHSHTVSDVKIGGGGHGHTYQITRAYDENRDNGDWIGGGQDRLHREGNSKIWGGEHTHTFSGTINTTGNGDKFPIMQPWIACNIWVRTA